jgi:hypothetical protein
MKQPCWARLYVTLVMGFCSIIMHAAPTWQYVGGTLLLGGWLYITLWYMR